MGDIRAALSRRPHNHCQPPERALGVYAFNNKNPMGIGRKHDFRSLGQSASFRAWFAAMVCRCGGTTRNFFKYNSTSKILWEPSTLPQRTSFREERHGTDR